MTNKRAIVLLSGGLDSATTLYLAKKQRFNCVCLVFDYGQRHRREIIAAKKIAKISGCKWQVVKIRFPWKGSSLLDRNLEVTKSQSHKVTRRIPNTYVPARNIIFLSFALSYAEAIKAQAIFIGAHSQDYSGYPDCRPQFFRAFDNMACVGTKCGLEKKKIAIRAPLLYKNKAEIIKIGYNLGVPLALTWSCYRGVRRPCGKCESCYFRAKGFKEAGIRDGSQLNREVSLSGDTSALAREPSLQ